MSERQQAADADGAETHARNRKPDIADSPPRVLIVDDEPHNRQLLEVMLTPEGFVLETAATGEEALHIVTQRPPDLILLDVMMPGMDGYEVTARIKAQPSIKSIPVIMITALDDRAARIRGLTAGAEDFLSKPVDRAELTARVRNLLRLKAYGDYFARYSQVLEWEVGLGTSKLADRNRLSDSALRMAEERMRFALESAGVGIWDMDYTTGVLQWSTTAEAHYGLQAGTFTGKFEDFVDHVHPEDRQALLDTLATAMKTGADFTTHNRSVGPDGQVRWLTGTGRILLGEHGEPLRGIGISQNVTERRTLEAQYQQAQKMEAIGQLASGVAHDFNNLLTAILGFAGFVVADTSIGQQHTKDLEEIIKAAQRATRLTKQLLAFSRQQVLQTTPLDVNGLLREMIGMLGRLIGEHIEVKLALAPALSLAVADRGQLEQVVMNLVVNARDAMPGGGTVTIETSDVGLENSSFHEETVMHGHYVMLAITDTGSGMTKDTQRRLFEPFFTTKEIGKGTGLGLSTTYGIIKQSKGYIWVYSELGRGTTFKVYLPRSNDNAPLQLTNPSTTTLPKSASETVLLVEDEAELRQLAKRMLSNAGFKVLEAANGDEAEQLFKQHGNSVDLVVTDAVMPGCGGPELVRRLQVESPSLRVLYMSGYTEQTVANSLGLNSGVPFVQKPFTAAEFVRAVHEALDRG